jgi:hypothetical protein
MQKIESRYEELMGVLLLISGQVAGILPNQNEQVVERYWRRLSRVELLKDVRYLAHHAVRQLAVVSVCEEVIAENGTVDEHLNHCV